MNKHGEPGSGLMRIDRWLWCARFYKTRNLAAEAVKGGKVLIDNARIKPAKLVQPGEQLKIRRGPFIIDIEILALSTARLPAKEAVKIYRETDESLEKRELLQNRLKMENINYPKSRGRPTKRDRRKLIRFKTRG